MGLSIMGLSVTGLSFGGRLGSLGRTGGAVRTRIIVSRSTKQRSPARKRVGKLSL